MTERRSTRTVVQQVRPPGTGDRARPRGGSGGAAKGILILVVAGALAVGWYLRDDERAAPGDDGAGARYGPDEDARWTVQMRAVRSTTGFTVVPLGPADLANASELRDMFEARRENMPVVFTADRFRATLDTLRGLLPAGETDPFGYGVAWSWRGIPYELDAEPLDML